MKKWTHVVAALLMAPAMAAFAQSEGVTKDSIKIGMFAPLSGSSVGLGLDTSNAARMYYEKVNKEGGIHGRKIEVAIEDDRCSANDAVAAVKKLVEQEKVFLLHGGSCSPATVATKEYVERSKVPLVVLNAAVDALVYPPSPYIYAAFAGTQHTIGGSTIGFVTDHLKAKRIGYIAHDDAYGAWNVEAVQFMIQRRPGTELLLQQVSGAINDVTAPMLRLRTTNPDVLVIATYPRAAALIMKKAAESGFNQPIVLSVNSAFDLQQLVENVANPAAFKNVYVQINLADVPGGPKLKWAYDLFAASYPDLASKPGRPQPYMVQGLPSAIAIVSALKAAGPNLTRERFLAEMEKLNIDPGVMAGPIQFSPTNHAALEHMRYAKFDGQQMVPVPGSFPNLWRPSAK